MNRPLFAPRGAPIRGVPVTRMIAPQDQRAQGLADLSEDQMEALGLPPQDLINALYDIFGSYPRKNVLPYFMSFSLTAAGGNQLGALGTARPSIKVTADAAFIGTLFTGSSTGAYSIFLRTDSSDRQLMQTAVHSSSVIGTGERPFPLPKPLLLAPNTTVSFEVTDLSGAPNDVWVTMCGFKVYRRQYAAAG